METLQWLRGAARKEHIALLNKNGVYDKLTDHSLTLVYARCSAEAQSACCQKVQALDVLGSLLPCLP